MSKSKKHVLEAAKKKIYNELLSEYQNAVAEVGLLLGEECSGDDKKDLDRLEKARAKVEEAYQKIDDWKQSPRAKKKKSVTWSSDYEASTRPKPRIVKTEAYGDFKESSPADKKPVALWLEEGALVCKRGHHKAMIVLTVGDGSSQILNDGTVEWHRNLSLRPFEIEV